MALLIHFNDSLQKAEFVVVMLLMVYNLMMQLTALSRFITTKLFSSSIPLR